MALQIIIGTKVIMGIIRKSYFSQYLKNVFVASTINKFDYSVKKQNVSSSKFYTLDNSFLKTVAFNFSENKGSRLENLVFIELIRRGSDVYYHMGKKECDFVIKEGLKITKVIQVSVSLDNIKTRKREIVQARQLAMYFSKQLTKNSLASIGAQCGNKDHATVLHACRTVNNLTETDKRFRTYVDDLRKKLTLK
jgi:hypothetical protein